MNTNNVLHRNTNNVLLLELLLGGKQVTLISDFIFHVCYHPKILFETSWMLDVNLTKIVPATSKTIVIFQTAGTYLLYIWFCSRIDLYITTKPINISNWSPSFSSCNFLSSYKLRLQLTSTSYKSV